MLSYRLVRVLQGAMAVAFIAVLGVSVTVIGMSLLQPNSTYLAAQHHLEPTLQVVVEPGDTLWGIAKQFFPDTDPRIATLAIQNSNNLIDAVIYPGQIISLPLFDNNGAVQIAVIHGAY